VNGDDWYSRAACRPHPTKWWYSSNQVVIRQAKRICAACPVSTECLHDAEASAEEDGMRGGLTPEERGYGRVPPHGTRARYWFRGGACRCELCREANAAYQRDRKARLDVSTCNHGTLSGYADHGCRCDDCRAAKAAYVRKRAVTT
jgi:WhiB family redox-sensing transcriptional regulator